MAIPLIAVSHKVTGRKTFLPQTALAFFPDYEPTPSQKARDEQPDGSAFLADADEREAALIEPAPAPEPDADTDEQPAAAKTSRRSKQS